MTVDVMHDIPSREVESPEALGTQLTRRLRIATSAIQQGIGSSLDTYYGKLAASSSLLGSVQVGICMLASRGMDGGTGSQALALFGGTAAAFVAQRFRDVYLQDEAGRIQK